MPDFEYHPLSELSHDVDPTEARVPGQVPKFSFGTDVFGGSSDWIIVENGTTPVKVYKIPPPVSRMLHYLSKVRFDAGRDDAQEQMRRALGVLR